MAYGRKTSMIRPEEFYDTQATLNDADRKRLWKRIRRALPEGRRPVLVISDGRSFFSGMAAAVLIGFAILGGLQTIRRMHETPESELVRAYQSAISQFEAVVPASSEARGEALSGQVQSWKNQIGLIDAAIADLRRDIREGGPSPLKHTKLRELYALKLQVLQTMVENGGVQS
jgi:hypothetical protein